jgi:hypothetical protein
LYTTHKTFPPHTIKRHQIHPPPLSLPLVHLSIQEYNSNKDIITHNPTIHIQQEIALLYDHNGTHLIAIQTTRLTRKGRGRFFGLFLEFGQSIVDAIFVQKISNFWGTCGLVLASRRTNFYKIPISSSAIIPQK